MRRDSIAAVGASTMSMKDLKTHYIKEVLPAMKAKFGYRNTMAVPRIVKVVVNVGAGRLRDAKEHEEVQKYLGSITGQIPARRPAKKAIASFKIRQGQIVGYQVTLRGRRMYDFLTRFIVVALPRTRDFWGINPDAFDMNGNLTVGVKEHIVFPEMIGEDYRLLFGLEVTIVTTAKNREEGVELLKLMGFPVKK